MVIIGDDTSLIEAWNAIGDYYLDRQKFGHAITYYSQGRNYPQLAECYYRLEDFAQLKRLVDTLPPNNPTLEVSNGKGLWVWSNWEVIYRTLLTSLRLLVCVRKRWKHF